MKRDDDPPEDEERCDPESSSTVRWREQMSLDDLRRCRARGTASDAAVDFATEHWIDQFQRGYSRETMESVCRFAARMLSLGARVTPGDYAARELANDAVHDTLAGNTRWDPAQKTLKRHLCDVVKRRVLAAHERAERLPHVSIDALGPDGRAAANDEMEHALRAQLPDARAVEAARTDVTELRRRAADDPDVLALISALSQDRISRADAMAATGFSLLRYRAARRRLKRLVEAMRGDLGRPGNGQE